MANMPIFFPSGKLLFSLIRISEIFEIFSMFAILSYSDSGCPLTYVPKKFFPFDKYHHLKNSQLLEVEEDYLQFHYIFQKSLSDH